MLVNYYIVSYYMMCTMFSYIYLLTLFSRQLKVWVDRLITIKISKYDWLSFGEFFDYILQLFLWYAIIVAMLLVHLATILLYLSLSLQSVAGDVRCKCVCKKDTSREIFISTAIDFEDCKCESVVPGKFQLLNNSSAPSWTYYHNHNI